MEEKPTEVPPVRARPAGLRGFVFTQSALPLPTPPQGALRVPSATARPGPDVRRRRPRTQNGGCRPQAKSGSPGSGREPLGNPRPGREPGPFAAAPAVG